MNEPNTDDRPTLDDPLGSHLAALSEPRGEPATIWVEALAQSRGGTRTHSDATPRSARLGAKRFFSRSLRIYALAALVLVATTLVMLPQMRVSNGVGSRGPMYGMEDAKRSNAIMPERSRVDLTNSLQGFSGSEKLSDTQPAVDPTALARGEPPSPPPPPGLDASLRQVIRKATIELTTKDVPASFAKASLLINESLGEFIERSALRDNAPAVTSELVLRVSASRLGAVLTELRHLGAVTSETAGGDDVTDRVVDLEARLRNERRIESELLKLLDSRTNSPLDDVLKLRTELSRVRLGIEQLEGQRQQLSKAVSLATVLVLIRSDGATIPPTPASTGLGEYFTRTMSKSWTSGVKGLADSVSIFVENLLAGLVWWIMLLIIGVFAFALVKRAYMAAASEPAPRV